MDESKLTAEQVAALERAEEEAVARNKARADALVAHDGLVRATAPKSDHLVSAILNRNEPGRVILAWYCPGCRQPHLADVSEPSPHLAETPWTWSGDLRRPSIEGPPIPALTGPCHVRILRGRALWREDSGHWLALARKEMAMEAEHADPFAVRV